MPADEPTPPPSAERNRNCQALVDRYFEHGDRNTTLPRLLDRAAVDLTTFERTSPMSRTAFVIKSISSYATNSSSPFSAPSPISYSPS